MLMLLPAACTFGQGGIPAEKQATNVGNWTSVTVTPAQTLKTTWNFESIIPPAESSGIWIMRRIPRWRTL